MTKQEVKQMIELHKESGNKTQLVEKYDEFDWLQLMSLDDGDPIYEDNKELMRSE